jgi:hypothetical protein
MSFKDLTTRADAVAKAAENEASKRDQSSKVSAERTENPKPLPTKP